MFNGFSIICQFSHMKKVILDIAEKHHQALFPFNVFILNKLWF